MMTAVRADEADVPATIPKTTPKHPVSIEKRPPTSLTADPVHVMMPVFS
jgi:hypothetical protein